ncbi:hypothetical protein V6B16_14930 [Salinimicrobium catena]|uniref:hypothetical protein n=1 Tax=Salinimicrobium catena TaxID=390640 RepID=UPI002FE46BFB
MKVILILALTFFILSHICLILMFALENALQESDFPYIFVVWGVGIINVVLNVYYGIELKLKKRMLILLIISGLTWAFPPLLFTFFGIPFLIVYLGIGLNMHGQKSVILRRG